MKVKEIAKKYNFPESFYTFCWECTEITFKGLLRDTVDDSDVPKLLALYKKYVEDEKTAAKATEERLAEKRKNAAEIGKNCTTTNGFENAVIEQYFGTVTTANAYATKNWATGAFGDQAAKYKTCFEEAKQELLGQALRLGANAVVGMQVSQVYHAEVMHMIIVLTGTAVKIKKNDTP